jgi:hypothetical protein
MPYSNAARVDERTHLRAQVIETKRLKVLFRSGDVLVAKKPLKRLAVYSGLQHPGGEAAPRFA